MLVGGVGELYQTDMDFGRLVANRLMAEEHPRGVVVEDLSYGAIPFVHRLQELTPDCLVLVGMIERGRAPGTVHRRRVTHVDRSVEELQGAVGDAYVGYVDLDLSVEVAWSLDVLPPRTIVIEVEPETTGPGEELTATATDAIEPAMAAVRREVVLAPLYDVVARLRPRIAELRARLAEDPAVTATDDEELRALLPPDPAADAADILDVLADLLDQLELKDLDGRWGRTFEVKDDLRLTIASGVPSGDMDHADWGMMWGLVEELTRLQALTVDHPDL